jgi:hypothetical protein
MKISFAKSIRLLFIGMFVLLELGKPSISTAASFAQADSFATIFQPPSQKPTPDDPTADWKTFSDNRSNINFKFKYPRNWDDPSDHCNLPPNPNNFNLSASCIKTVIFTDQLDQFSNDNGMDLALISETYVKVNGYNATRQVFSSSSDSAIPDTYELWVYDATGNPFFLYVAWIGTGTDQKTAEDFVQILDREVRTLQLRRH